MDIKNIVNCSCGREHPKINMKVEIGPGLLDKTAEILADFPRNILVVADKNTLAASDGLLDILKSAGFSYGLHCYDNCIEADITEVKLIEKLLTEGETSDQKTPKSGTSGTESKSGTSGTESKTGISGTESKSGTSGLYNGVLAVGSGSIGDICRLASFNTKKRFAIFATAPSMDGFASSSAPITYDCFKETVLCHAPEIIIGDTDILSKAPIELKTAGFGDVIAKYVALVDWKIASWVADEYYCPTIAQMVMDALEKTMSQADKIEEQSAAQAVMEALVMSGVCMALTNITRPASAAEHLLAHYWEMMKLKRREKMPFHGTKVGIGTLMIAKLYHDVANDIIEPDFQEDYVDWDKVYAAYGPGFESMLDRLNNPTIMEKTNREVIKKYWPDIRRVIKDELPTYEELLKLMKTAGAATTIEEIDVDRQMALDSLMYHSYMRYRINLTRLIPMLGYKPDYDRYVTVGK